VWNVSWVRRRYLDFRRRRCFGRCEPGPRWKARFPNRSRVSTTVRCLQHVPRYPSRAMRVSSGI
jgi:hypothetical protein